MKNITALLIPLFFAGILPATAQNSDDVKFILNAEKNSIVFQNKRFYSSDKIPFKDIIVLDYRYDSSKIGYVEIGTFKKNYCQIRLRETWTNILNSYFKNNLDASSNNTLVIAVRSFWMQDGIQDELTSKKIIQKAWLDKKNPGIPGVSNSGGSCKSELDIYIKSDSTLQACFKIEARFLNFNSFIFNNLDQWFFLPFDSVAKKIISTDMSTVISKRKKLSEEEVRSFYMNRFELPVLINPISQKGIFLTFDDFKKNKLWLTDFKQSKGKLTDELYVVNNKQEVHLSEYWGFTDNNNLFIKIGYSIYPAVRQQNSFEVYGGKHISNIHNNPVEGDLIRINSMKIDKKILQLNMDKGVFY